MSINLRDIKYSYGSEFLLEVDLDIPKGLWVLLVGKSGAGKTTLLKILSGIITPNSGEVEYFTKSSNIGFIFQNPDDQIIQLSVEKELAFNLENKTIPINIIDKKVKQSLRDYDFLNREKTSPNNLSGGEKQRLALAATLISDPDILIFDEPSSFLDYKQKELLYQRVKELKPSGKTIIWSSHEIDEFFLADYIIELENGKVAFRGEPREYLEKISRNDYIFEYLKE